MTRREQTIAEWRSQIQKKLKDDEMEIAILPIDSIIRYLNRIAVNVNIKEGENNV